MGFEGVKTEGRVEAQAPSSKGLLRRLAGEGLLLFDQAWFVEAFKGWRVARNCAILKLV
jgi:hypothetical protein